MKVSEIWAVRIDYILSLGIAGGHTRHEINYLAAKAYISGSSDLLVHPSSLCYIVPIHLSSHRCAYRQYNIWKHNLSSLPPIR